MMISGLASAYQATGDQQFLDKALKAAEFIRDEMTSEEGHFWRNYKDGQKTINAFLDDHANYTKACIDLYESTFDEQWLNVARDRTAYVIEHFSDEEGVYFFFTSDLDPPLVTRKKELIDNVVPASNSVMANNLHKLSLYLYKPDWGERASQMLGRIAQTITEADQPHFQSNWLRLYLDMMRPPYEVAVAGADYKALLSAFHETYLTNAIFLGGPDEGNLELLKDKLQEGSTYIYVCRNKVCKFPVTTVPEALELMD